MQKENSVETPARISGLDVETADKGGGGRMGDDDLLRDALDHIARLARSSRTSTARYRLIQQRAEDALAGRTYTPPLEGAPPDVVKEYERTKAQLLRAKFENNALRDERNTLRDIIVDIEWGTRECPCCGYTAEHGHGGGCRVDREVRIAKLLASESAQPSEASDGTKDKLNEESGATTR